MPARRRRRARAIVELMGRVRLLVVLAIAFGISFVSLGFEASEPEFFSVDYTTRAFVQSAHPPWLDGLMHRLSDVGSGYVLVPANVVVFVVLAVRRQPRPWLIPALTGGAVLLEVVTKWVVHRPRPKGAAYGFPSGHVTASVVFFGLLIYLLWNAARPIPGRWALTALGALIVVGVAYSRLYFNAHWLSDVLGGLLGGGAYLGSSLAWYEWQAVTAARSTPGW